MLEHLFLGQRCVGHRREQKAIRARRLRIARQILRIVRPQRAHAGQERHPPGKAACRCFNGTAPLGAVQIRVGAGAAEYTNRIDHRFGEPAHEAPDAVRIDTAIRVGRRDGEGGEATKHG